MKIRRALLVILFVFFAYHLIRDVLQDILNIHNPLIDIAHYKLDTSKLPWYLGWLNFGGYRKYYSIPIELFILLIIPLAYKEERLSKFSLLVTILSISFLVIWLIGIPYGNFYT